MSRLALFGECEERVVTASNSSGIYVSRSVVEDGVLKRDGGRWRRRWTAFATGLVDARRGVGRVPKAGGGETARTVG